MWSKFPLATFNSSWRTLMRAGTTGGNHQVLVDPSSNLGMYDNDVGGGFRPSGYNVSGLSGWHHLVAVGAGITTSGTTTYYIDNSYVGQSDTNSSNDTIDYIGNYQGGGQNWGSMDEFRVYNRNLDASEIRALYLGI
jgi:hypothetical protein